MQVEGGGGGYFLIEAEKADLTHNVGVKDYALLWSQNEGVKSQKEHGPAKGEPSHSTVVSSH